MAMVRCPECKKEVSSEASTCPSCGYDFAKAKKKKQQNQGTIGCLVVIIFIIAIYFIGKIGGSRSSSFSLSSSTSSSSTETSQVPQTTEQIDTSGYFIASILNCSPKEVAKQLGDPDGKFKPSNDCDYLPSCNAATYQNRKYEGLYYNNKLKQIIVNVKGFFNNNAICYVGFPSCVPTLANEYGIWWRSPATRGTASGPLIPINGIREVCAFPEYILISVETNYDKKFEKLDKQTRDNAKTETQKQEKVETEKSAKHKQMIEEQFSSWDGSHINLTKEIKKAMNDPDSYKHISTKYFDLGDHIKVVTEFRGTNSFGAIVKNTVIAQVGLDGHIIDMETVK